MPATLPSTLPATLPATQATTQAASQPVVPPTADEPLPKDDHQIQADAVLAEQIAGIAELEFTTKITRNDVWPLVWRHQAALLSACARLDPKAARFPRLVADAMVQLEVLDTEPIAHSKDREHEIEALRLAIIADPSDEFSWNRRLDLFLVPMQTSRDKIVYLRDIISRSSGDLVVPADVRAHAGFRLAQLLLERGEVDAAKTALAEALRNCPSSVECLKLRYQMLAPHAPAFERVGQLLDLLRANPLQVRYSNELADLIASNGLVQESLPFYKLAVASAHLQGDPARHAMLNWAAELYIGDEVADAVDLNLALLKIDPTYAPAHFLQLVMTRSDPNKDVYSKALQRATNALSNRVVEVCNAAAPAGATKATTRPIADESPLQLPDLAPTVALIKDGKVSEPIKQQFIETVADLALLEGYFAEQTDMSTKLVDVLKGVLPENSPVLVRLQGWNDLLARKPLEAKSKFTAVAADDPLAELGLVKVMLDNPANPTERAAAESICRRLLQDNPAGLIGALLWENLHSERVKLISTTQADAMREAVTQFPAGLLLAADKPQDFYAVHVEPAPSHVGSFVGEPLLALVSVRNLSENDLTIGPDGVLKPELIFSVKPKVGNNPSFSAFDNIAGPTVLSAHGKLDQIVRIDQTQLLAFLNNQAAFEFEVTGSLTTNQTAGGLGGYPVQFFKSFFRFSSATTSAHMQQALTDLSEGTPDKKITALNLLQRYASDLMQVKNPGMDIRQQIGSMVNAIHRARVDPLLSVSAWAFQCEYSLVSPDDRANIVRDLTDSPDWRHRQIGLLLVNAMEPAARDEIIAKLLQDPQTSVREDAIAVKAFMALPSTTAPTTAPTTPPMP